MTDKEKPPTARAVPNHAIFWFFGLTFAISWTLLGVYVLAPTWATASFGAIGATHPFFFLATWAPAISAILLVLVYTGPSGLGAFFSRLTLWRLPKVWVAFVFVGIPLVFVAGSLLKSGPLLAPMPPEGIGAVFAILFMMLFLGPIEEFGWRGMAQPLLQRHMAPLWAGALIGTVWGMWHLPAFFLSSTVFAEWNFLPFLLGNITLAILVTPLFNSARGSLLWPMLFHWQLINPFWPDAQPFDTWILMAVAAVVVWWNRDTMFSHHKAVTDVIPASSGDTQ